MMLQRSVRKLEMSQLSRLLGRTRKRRKRRAKSLHANLIVMLGKLQTITLMTLSQHHLVKSKEVREVDALVLCLRRLIVRTFAQTQLAG